MISFIGQVLLVIGLAGGVFWAIPIAVYVLVGFAMAAVIGGLMVGSESKHLEITLGYTVSMVVIAILFGVFWPALPVIAVWGGVKRKRAESLKERAAKDSPSPSSPVDP